MHPLLDQCMTTGSTCMNLPDDNAMCNVRWPSERRLVVEAQRMPKRKKPPPDDVFDDTKKATASAQESNNNVIEPRNNDVLFGRGDSINRHPGNKKFRELVDSHKRVYLASRFKQEKRMIADGILAAIGDLDPPGRFLAKNPTSGLWEPVETARAREKALQALREKARSVRDQEDNTRDMMLRQALNSSAAATVAAAQGLAVGTQQPLLPSILPGQPVQTAAAAALLQGQASQLGLLGALPASLQAQQLMYRTAATAVVNPTQAAAAAAAGQTPLVSASVQAMPPPAPPAPRPPVLRTATPTRTGPLGQPPPLPGAIMSRRRSSASTPPRQMELSISQGPPSESSANVALAPGQVVVNQSPGVSSHASDQATVATSSTVHAQPPLPAVRTTTAGSTSPQEILRTGSDLSPQNILRASSAAAQGQQPQNMESALVSTLRATTTTAAAAAAQGSRLAQRGLNPTVDALAAAAAANLDAVPMTPRHLMRPGHLGASPISAGTFEALQMIAFPESPGPGSLLGRHAFSPRRLPPLSSSPLLHRQQQQQQQPQGTASFEDRGSSTFDLQMDSPLASETWPRRQRRRLQPRSVQRATQQALHDAAFLEQAHQQVTLQQLQQQQTTLQGQLQQQQQHSPPPQLQPRSLQAPAPAAEAPQAFAAAATLPQQHSLGFGISPIQIERREVAESKEDASVSTRQAGVPPLESFLQPSTSVFYHQQQQQPISPGLARMRTTPLPLTSLSRRRPSRRSSESSEHQHGNPPV